MTAMWDILTLDDDSLVVICQSKAAWSWARPWRAALLAMFWAFRIYHWESAEPSYAGVDMKETLDRKRSRPNRDRYLGQGPLVRWLSPACSVARQNNRLGLQALPFLGQA